MNTCKYEKMQRWVSYDSGITWSPMDEYQKGELIERDSVDCGYTPTPPPTPQYRWTDVSGYCEGVDYRILQKLQVSYDEGVTWEDMVPEITQWVIEYDSEHCQPIPPTPGVEYRWVDLPLQEDYYCSGTTKYYKQKKQQSTDSGSTWSDVVPAEYRMGASAETQSADCGYATRTTSGSPYCVGVDKCVDIYHQESEDSGTTWTTTSTTVSVIEYDSEDCGYVPPTPSYSGDYLTFRARENGSFKFDKNGLSYSLDSGQTWTSIGANANTPTVASGTTIMWKGTMTPSTTGYVGIGTFSSTKEFDAEGNVMSLLYGDNFSGQTSLAGTNYAFDALFYNCKLVNAENLSLPATTLGENCYNGMFFGCSGLTTAPQLPATTLAYGCYEDMFCYCRSLTTPPTLPATTLAVRCYDTMFRGCWSLTTLTALPATTLADSCYAYMFDSCSGLTTAPVLPATTLTPYCYCDMFSGCRSLTTAPVLPAPTLEEECYREMFVGCTSLSAITCLASDMSASNCTDSWVHSVASNGVFIKDANTTWSRGSSGIPNNWTIQDAT